MEGGPAPIVIGYPHPLIFAGPHPMSTSAVRTKVNNAGMPYVTILWVVDPVSVWSQIIVKSLISHTRHRFLGRCRCTCSAEQHHKECHSAYFQDTFHVVFIN